MLDKAQKALEEAEALKKGSDSNDVDTSTEVNMFICIFLKVVKAKLLEDSSYHWYGGHTLAYGPGRCHSRSKACLAFNKLFWVQHAIRSYVLPGKPSYIQQYQLVHNCRKSGISSICLWISKLSWMEFPLYCYLLKYQCSIKKCRYCSHRYMKGSIYTRDRIGRMWRRMWSEVDEEHKEKVAELRDAFSDEDRENEDEEEEDDGFVSVDEVENLKEEFEGVEIRNKEKDGDEESESDEEFVDVDDGEKERMIMKTKMMTMRTVFESNKNEGGMKETDKKEEREEPEIVDQPKISSKAEVDEKSDDGSYIEEPIPSDEPCAENGNNGGDDAPTVKQAAPVKVSSKSKVSKQAPAVKVTNKKEVNSKAKKSTRGMKKKGTSTNSGHECDTCGVDFDSRELETNTGVSPTV
nr:DnaJ heat shock N-terminal domain-containing protein [Tanacetum cinerariifolium]